MTVLHVPIGGIVTTAEPGDEIRMVGLGSCVGVFLVVPGEYAAAAHVLLPYRQADTASPPGKYADTAIPHLVDHLSSAGYPPTRVRGAIAGGAQVFQFSGSRPEFEIGARNTAAVKELLRANRLTIGHDDTGGDKARTVTLSVATGTLM